MSTAPSTSCCPSPPLLRSFSDFDGWPRFQYWDDIPQNVFSTGLTHLSMFVEVVPTKQCLGPNPVVTLATMYMPSFLSFLSHFTQYHASCTDFGNFETLLINTHPIFTVQLFLNSTNSGSFPRPCESHAVRCSSLYSPLRRD